MATNAKLIFLHGGGLNRAMWQPQIAAFTPRYTCHAIDLPGHGTQGDHAFTMDAAVEAVAERIGASASPATILVGLSLGSYVALEAAARGTPEIAGFVLSGCAAHYHGLLRMAVRLNLAALRLYPQRAFQRHWQKQLRGQYPAETADSLLSEGVSLPGARDGLREALGVDVPRLVRSVDVPVLLLNGENDRLHCRAAAALDRAHAHVTTQTLAGAGHLCNLDRPEAFNDAVAAFAAHFARAD